MPIEILMPAVSPSMTEGGIAHWLKQEGDRVQAGEPLLEIETDKAVVEYESPHGGVLARIVVPDGSANIKVERVIALLLQPGEDPAMLALQVGSKTVAPIAQPGELVAVTATPAAGTQVAASIVKARPAQIAKASSRIHASPLARRLATQRNIDLALLGGSGPGGRIVKRDIDSADMRPPVASDAAPGAAYESIAHNSMRRLIARRLSEAKQTIPHFYLTIDCQIDALLDMRKELNAWGDNLRLSVNDFIIKAVALAMRKVPGVNASWTDLAMRRYRSVDIAVAVSTPSGLVTPIVRNADRKSLSELSSEVKELANRGRAGKLQAAEYQGGGFTISNLGMFGVREFAAIINPPQSCILAVGAGEQRPVVKDGALAVATVMSCTLSADHRVVDGALGAEFLAAFKSLIEHPLNMVL